MCKKGLYLLIVCVLFCVSPGTMKAEQIWGEAEVASSITAPLQIVDDAMASGGEYITVAAGNNSSGNPPSTGIATYRIRIKEGGVYTMYLRVLCAVAGDDDDSCWVRIQGATLNIAVATGDWIMDNNIDDQVANSQAWFWKQVGHYAAYPGNDFIEFTMTPGTYTVEIAYREDGLWIDGFLITNDADVDTATLPDVIPFVPENISRDPQPANGESDVSRDVALSWTPAELAKTHNVYIGRDFDDVNEATVTDPLSTVLIEGLDVDSYDPPGRLEFGTTYYWRVDEVNGAPDFTVYDGTVWSFTVESYSYPIANVNATASSSDETTTGPERSVDGSGLDPDDQHSTDGADMWLSAKGVPFPHWIQYEFDKVYKLDQMWVWNSNQSLESIVGLGAENVAVQYSTNGLDWTDLGDFVFARGSGAPSYTANTQIAFGGVPAKYVKLTISSNWGHIFQQAGLSEVRFLHIPVFAREPAPADAATNVHPQVALSWRPGREADSHDVYVGTDPNAVADGTAPMTTVAAAEHDVAADLEQTYYWKVVEVNQVETPSAWPGDVWSFSTATYISIDDFESYTNDSPNRVFQAWIDGGGFSPDAFFPNGHNGNGTDSLVGYDPLAGDIMETTYFYGGQQSMPLYYDGSRSEADHTFDPPQDWTKHNITTLVLFFRGNSANGAAPVYIKINGTKLTYNNGAASTTTPVWKQWNIDLASVAGVDLTSVKTLTIGLGDGIAGVTGTLFVDEIRLYATAPEITVPADPGTTGLIAYYAMNDNANDGSGNGNNGTLSGEPGFAEGKSGKALAFDGVNDCVDLGNKAVFNPTGSFSVSLWANIGAWGTAWGHVMVGNRGEDSVGWQVRRHSGTSLCFTTRGVDQDDTASRFVPPLNTWIHITCVYDDAASTKTIYIDGTRDTVVNTTAGAHIAATTHNTYIGARALADNTGPEAFFTGLLDEIGIFNRALTAGEAAYLAGDR